MNGQALLPEFDHEMANTRTALERIPDDKLDFKPHEKSFSLLELGAHLANLPNWAPLIMTTTELDMDQPMERPEPTSRDEILAEFDKARDAAREIVAGCSGDDLMVEWSLITGGEVAFSMPRIGVYRSFIMNHMVHHRGQLTVYLRLLDLPVPALYGPSADEAM